MSYPKKLKLCATLLAACLALTGAAPAQSTRPGWGSIPYHGASGTGVTFRVWAPNATALHVTGDFNGWSTTANALGKELTNGSWTGVWSADVANAAPGQQYKYYIAYSGGHVSHHDPRARFMVAAGDATGTNDIIYDPTAFNWNGDSLTPPAQNDLFIYELHMGTFPSNAVPNRFTAATNSLDYLKSLGVNAVEVMPVVEFGNANSSWGYDPTQQFAVDNGQYGGPDGFKTFVQACHARGLAVFVDVVHNHYGPGLLDMWNFDGYTGGGPIGGGIYFYQSNSNLEITPYGNTRPNFSSNQVCNFIQDSFTMWLDEYHVDGFRWDTPGLMMNATGYGSIPAASNLVTAINAMIHTNYMGKISIAEDVYNSFGFDSAWDTTYPDNFTPVLTNTVDANRNMTVIANAVQDNVRYGGTAGQGRVAYLESHDVVGDLNNGVRLVTAIDPATPDSYRARKLSTLGSAVTLTAPGIPMIFQGQEMLENQSFDSSLPVDWTKTNTYSYIVQFYRDLINARRNLKGYTPGLEGDQCHVFQVDNFNKLVAFNRWNSADTNQDAVVIANFANAALTNYSLNFPAAGNWYVHLNSDSTHYGPDYGNIGGTVVTASGSPAAASITIGPYSALILSQIPEGLPQLTVTVTNGNVSIAWPASSAGWVLDTAGSLTDNSWTEVPPDEYETNASAISTSAALSNGNSFYRLRKL